MLLCTNTQFEILDFKLNMKLYRDPYEEEYEDFKEEDDVIYAELRRQVLLLTADEEKGEEESDLHERNQNLIPVGACKRGGSQGSTSFAPALQPGSYFNWWEGESNANTAPTWLVNLWRSGNGTGVFIPHIVKSRRHHNNKPGRTRNEGRKAFRQVGSQR